jgi:hypothetical protein
MSGFAPSIVSPHKKSGKFSNILKQIRELSKKNNPNKRDEDFMEVLENTVESCKVLKDTKMLGNDDIQSCNEIIKMLENIYKEWFLLDDNGNPIRAEDSNRDIEVPIDLKEEIEIIKKQAKVNPFGKCPRPVTPDPDIQDVIGLTEKLKLCEKKVTELQENLNKKEGGKGRQRSRRNKIFNEISKKRRINKKFKKNTISRRRNKLLKNK